MYSPFEGWIIVKSHVNNILVHGPSFLDTMAKIFEGEKKINPFKCQLIGFSGKNKINIKLEN